MIGNWRAVRPGNGIDKQDHVQRKVMNQFLFASSTIIRLLDKMLSLQACQDLWWRRNWLGEWVIGAKVLVMATVIFLSVTIRCRYTHFHFETNNWNFIVFSSIKLWNIKSEINWILPKWQKNIYIFYFIFRY